ncbi:MAG: DUF1127 domain-containing protein [Hyphomicrobiales bacterium]
MTDHTVSRAAGFGVANITSAARQFASHWLKRRRLHRLQQLDDNLLNDIGLLREEVHAAPQQPLSVDPVCDLNRRAWARRAHGPKFRFR